MSMTTLIPGTFREVSFKMPPSETFWSQLPEASKTDSIGERLEAKVAGKIAWRPVGKLQKFWDETCLRQYERAYSGNRDKIYHKSSTRDICSFDLFLLSESEEKQKAKPTVVVLCCNAEFGRKLIDIWRRHDSIKSLKTGFHYLQDTPDLVLRGGPHDEQVLLQSPFASLCGAQVEVSPFPVRESSKGRKLTAGGVLKLGEEWYVLTAAHPFYDYPKEKLSAEIESSQKNGTYFEGVPPTVDEHKLQNAPPKSGLYLNTLHGSHLGNFEAADVETEPTPQVGVSHYFCLEYDWALTQLRDSRFQRRNEAKLFDRRPIFPVFRENSARAHLQEVIVVANGPRSLRGRVISTNSRILVPWKDEFQEALLLECETSSGDSGAWVLSAIDNSINGMVIAGSSSHKLTYAIPAGPLFQSVYDRWSDRVSSVANMFPQSDVSDHFEMRLQVDAPVDSQSRTKAAARVAGERSLSTYLDEQNAGSARLSNQRLPVSEISETSSDPPWAETESQRSFQASGVSLTSYPESRSYLASGAAGLKPDTIREFLSIEINDFKSCERFVQQNPAIIDIDQEILKRESFSASLAGDSQAARSHAQKHLIINSSQSKLRSDGPDAVHDYLHRLATGEPSTRRDYYKDFDKLWDSWQSSKDDPQAIC